MAEGGYDTLEMDRVDPDPEVMILMMMMMIYGDDENRSLLMRIELTKTKDARSWNFYTSSWRKKSY